MLYMSTYDIFERFMGDSNVNKVKSIPYTIYRTKEKSSIELNLAGTKKENIDIDVKDKVLFITVVNEDGQKIREQRFVLPTNADAGCIQAEHRDGLLIVNVCDREASSVKIPIS